MSPTPDRPLHRNDSSISCLTYPGRAACVRCETDRIDYARNAIQPAYGCFGLLALAVFMHHALKSDDVLMHDGPDAAVV